VYVLQLTEEGLYVKRKTNAIGFLKMFELEFGYRIDLLVETDCYELKSVEDDDFPF